MDSEWIKFLIASSGMLVGYGMLKANVRTLQKQLTEHRNETHERFIRNETRAIETEKVLEGLKSTVESIDKRTEKIDSKLDTLLERR